MSALRRSITGVLFVLMCVAVPLSAHTDAPQTMASYFAGPVVVVDTTAKTTGVALTKDPTTAVLWSLLFPGLGQLYVESYWKVPLFSGVALGSAGFFIWNNNKYQDAQDRYDQAVADSAASSVISSLKREKEYYRDNRDLSGGIFLLTYILAAVDAYVGAHLHDFSVDDDLTLQLLPTRQGGVAACMVARF